MNKLLQPTTKPNALTVCTRFFGISFVMSLTLFATTVAQVGPDPVDLGTVCGFAILSKAGITNVPTSDITGDVGTSPITGASITGLECAEVTGTIYDTDGLGKPCFVEDATLLSNAVSAMEAAYTDAAGRSAAAENTDLDAGNLSGQTLTPGVYKWNSNVVINGDVTLDGGPNDTWIFQISGTLTQAPNTDILLEGGAKTVNIVWQTTETVAIQAGAHFEGTILAFTNITLGAGASVNGRLLAQTAVTLDQNTVNVPVPVICMTLTGNAGWRMLSTPVEVKLSDFLDSIWTQGVPNSDDPDAGDANVMIWDDSMGCSSVEFWEPVDLETTLDAGTGVLVYVFEDDIPKTLCVSGCPNPAGTIADVNENETGWSLLGNPFAGSVDFTDLDKTNLNDVVYVWDPNSGSWKSFSEGSGTGDLTDGIIAPFQGFFVQNNVGGASSVAFPEGAKTTGGSFMGKQQHPNVVRLELSGQGMRNAAWLSFLDHGSMDHAYGDAHQLQPLSPNYALLAGRKTDGLFDISVLSQPGQDFEFPLNVDATIGGTYTLKVTDFEYSGTESLFLEDRLKNQTIRLSDDMAYEFTLERPAQKAVTKNFGLINNCPAKAVADENDPRFVITAGETVDAEAEADLPVILELAQNYPNPFNPATVIEYTVPEQQHIRLAVYDLLGREISVLVDESHAPGSYQTNWDASQLSSGVYIYRLDAGGQFLTRRMILVK